MIAQGEVWWADLGEPAGSEPGAEVPSRNAESSSIAISASWRRAMPGAASRQSELRVKTRSSRSFPAFTSAAVCCGAAEANTAGMLPFSISSRNLPDGP